MHMRAQSLMYGSALSSTCVILMALSGLIINRYHLEIPLTEGYTVTGWRLHLLLNLIPGVISLFLMRKLPESPKFLFSANRKDECLHVLRTMYATNKGVSRFKLPVQRLESVGENTGHSHSSKRSM